MQEAVNEWLIMDEANRKFHMQQYDVPYRSTVKFAEFLCKRLNKKNNIILDMGCGAGAPLAYIMTNTGDYVGGGYGVDISEELVETGNSIIRERKIPNCDLICGDILNLDKSSFLKKINGIISLQTFSLFSSYKEIAKAMCQLEPEWIALSTLGFEGLIDYNIKLFDYTKNKDNGCAEVFYNIYSLPRMKQYFEDLGYNKFDYEKFEIDIDLPQTNKVGRGTYTVKTEDGNRIQISGGLMMPWYFVFVTK